MATHKTYLYPVWIRLWHLVNGLTFLVLLVTGISLHYSGATGGFIRFNTAVSLHNVAAIILILNYGVFLIGNLVSANGKYYTRVVEDARKNALTQARYYMFGVFKNEPHPFAINEERKFNPLQKIAYVAVMFVCMPLIIISGLGLLFPETVLMQVFGTSGLVLTDYLHQIMAFVFTVFLLVHIYLCTLGDKPGTLFKSMVNGYHEEHVQD
ncbi:MAG: cytochrome b/b6 domain-containing protein [Bacteroidales bacterium]